MFEGGGGDGVSIVDKAAAMGITYIPAENEGDDNERDADEFVYYCDAHAAVYLFLYYWRHWQSVGFNGLDGFCPVKIRAVIELYSRQPRVVLRLLDDVLAISEGFMAVVDERRKKEAGRK